MADKRRKPIRQYSLEGKFVREYQSSVEAGIAFGNKGGRIRLNATGVIGKAHGYIWRYKFKHHFVKSKSLIRIAKERRGKEKRWRKAISVKTRVCKCCHKRKHIDNFYKVKPPRIPRFKPDRRWDCWQCQNKRSKAAYFKRTTKKQRQIYMRTYMRTYNKAA